MPRRSSFDGGWNPFHPSDSKDYRGSPPVCASCGAEAGFQREESEFDGSQGGYWMHAGDGTPCVKCAARHGKYSGGSYYEEDLVMPSKEWKERRKR